MSLPTGRGSRQVRSCGLVRKRHARGRAAQVRSLEREIRARFSAVLLSRDSTREPQRSRTGMARKRRYGKLRCRVNNTHAALVSSHTRGRCAPPTLAPSHSSMPLRSIPGRSSERLTQEQYQPAPSQRTVGHSCANRRSMGHGAREQMGGMTQQEGFVSKRRTRSRAGSDGSGSVPI